MSNLKGSSAFDVFVCILHAPLLILLLKLVQNHRLPRIYRDVGFLGLPLLIAMTIFADTGYLTLFLLIVTEIYIVRNRHAINIEDNHALVMECKDKTYISLFKGEF